MLSRTQILRYLRLRYLGWAALGLAFAASVLTLYLDSRVRSEFEGRRFALPARIYARPLELHVGLRIPQPDVEQELRDLGYPDVAREGEAGWFARSGNELEIALRAFVFWDGPQPAKRLRVAFEGGAVTALPDAGGAELPLARLEPLPIGGIYPANNEDRVLVRLGEVPQHFVQALIAAEDRQFYSHRGFDPRALARAALSLASDKVQGGSTITQQLVKNFFLTPERTLQRKLTELMMAVLLELHYDKSEIRETYLNEIYFGQERDRAIHGVGLAAQFYFGKEVQHLTLAEAALLVGMVKGPAYYDPYRHPQRALERRNLVLRETREHGSITLEQYAAARATELGVTRKPAMGTSPYPAFLRLVHRQMRRDYDEADLRSEGLRIFTTLDPRVQRAAENALIRRLAQFDKERRFGEPGLEGAVVVTDPQSGEVQALVGGRDVRAVALYAAHAHRRRPLRLEKPRRSGLGAVELRQEVPRRGTAAGGAGAILQRRHGAPGHRARRRARARQRAPARHRARVAAVRLGPARRDGPESPGGGADVPDDRERRLARPIALDPRSHHAGRPAAAALSARGRAGIRARADVPPDRGHAGCRARGHGAGAEELPAARARGRRKDRHHRRAARRLVRRVHGRPARRRVDRLRRQPRGAPERGRRSPARLGRDDGRARSRAACPGQAGPHRAGVDRPANRIARQLERA